MAQQPFLTPHAMANMPPAMPQAGPFLYNQPSVPQAPSHMVFHGASMHQLAPSANPTQRRFSYAASTPTQSPWTITSTPGFTHYVPPNSPASSSSSSVSPVSSPSMPRSPAVASPMLSTRRSRSTTSSPQLSHRSLPSTPKTRNGSHTFHITLMQPQPQQQPSLLKETASALEKFKIREGLKSPKTEHTSQQQALWMKKIEELRHDLANMIQGGSSSQRDVLLHEISRYLRGEINLHTFMEATQNLSITVLGENVGIWLVKQFVSIADLLTTCNGEGAARMSAFLHDASVPQTPTSSDGSEYSPPSTHQTPDMSSLPYLTVTDFSNDQASLNNFNFEMLDFASQNGVLDMSPVDITLPPGPMFDDFGPIIYESPVLAPTSTPYMRTHAVLDEPITTYTDHPGLLTTKISVRTPRTPPNKWSKEESQKLITLVHQHGDQHWKKICDLLSSNKTASQCAQHWKRVLSPQIRKGGWNEREEELLFALVAKHGQSWKVISTEIKNRTDIQCRYQYLRTCMSREVAWTPSEDATLVNKVQKMTVDPSDPSFSWSEVAKTVHSAKFTKIPRSLLECKQRWMTLQQQQQQQSSPGFVAPDYPYMSQAPVQDMRAYAGYAPQDGQHNVLDNSYMALKPES